MKGVRLYVLRKVKSTMRVIQFYEHVIRPKDQLQASILQLLSAGLVLKLYQEPVPWKKSDYKELIFQFQMYIKMR